MRGMRRRHQWRPGPFPGLAKFLPLVYRDFDCCESDHRLLQSRITKISSRGKRLVDISTSSASRSGSFPAGASVLGAGCCRNDNAAVVSPSRMFRSQPHSETFRLLAMDINTLPGSGIVAVARRAVAIPGIEFLCYGESDQPSPQAAHDAAVAALDAGFTRYPDVRGVPALRDSLAAYLTGLHAKPVTEDRIQVTASGMAAVSIALAAIRAPRRPCGAAQPDLAQHSQRRDPARGGHRHAGPARAAGRQLPPRPGPAGRNAGRRSRLHPELAEQPHRLDRHARGVAAPSWTSPAAVTSG